MKNILLVLVFILSLAACQKEEMESEIIISDIRNTQWMRSMKTAVERDTVINGAKVSVYRIDRYEATLQFSSDNMGVYHYRHDHSIDERIVSQHHFMTNFKYTFDYDLLEGYIIFFNYDAESMGANNSSKITLERNALFQSTGQYSDVRYDLIKQN